MVRLGKQKVTQSTLAEALQVSRNTVARVLNNQPGVADATRKAVLEKAYELGYALPGTLSALETQVPAPRREVALLGRSDFLSNPFWLGIIQGLETYLSSQNITIRLALISRKQIEENQLPESLSIAELDGIVVTGTLPTSYYMAVQQLKLPTITYDKSFDMVDVQPQMDVITLNNHEAIAKITEQLIQAGHRRIAFAGSLTTSASFTERRRGFEDTMRLHQLEPVWIPSLERADSYGYIDVQVLLQELSALHERPTAYVCGNDSVVSTLLHVRKTSPELFGNAVFTSFDNFLSPEKTADLFATVDPHTAQVGHMMAVQLCARLQEPSLPHVTVSLETTPIFLSLNQAPEAHS